MIKNRSGKENENKYIMHEGTTKNEKARKIELTPEALNDLYAIKARRPNATKDDLCVVNLLNLAYNYINKRW